MDIRTKIRSRIEPFEDGATQEEVWARGWKNASKAVGRWGGKSPQQKAENRWGGNSYGKSRSQADHTAKKNP